MTQRKRKRFVEIFANNAMQNSFISGRSAKIIFKINARTVVAPAAPTCRSLHTCSTRILGSEGVIVNMWSLVRGIPLGSDSGRNLRFRAQCGQNKTTPLCLPFLFKLTGYKAKHKQTQDNAKPKIKNAEWSIGNQSGCFYAKIWVHKHGQPATYISTSCL